MNFFKAIGNFFIMIGKLFIMVFEILFKISCPISVFTNIHICANFWLLDIVFFLLWLLIYAIIFIFIYVPIVIGCAIMCVFVGAWMGKCWFIKPSDVCPTKKGFFNFMENLWQASFRKKLLYRDRGDIKMCYCVTALEDLFDPLRNFRSYLGEVSSDKSGGGMGYLIVPIIILGLVYYSNKRSSSQPSS